jgi:hypothetical protein
MTSEFILNLNIPSFISVLLLSKNQLLLLQHPFLLKKRSFAVTFGDISLTYFNKEALDMKNQKAEKYLNEVKGKKEKIWKFLDDMVEKQILWSIEKEVVNV